MSKTFAQKVELQLEDCWKEILAAKKAIFECGKDDAKFEFIGRYEEFLAQKSEAREDLEGFTLLKATTEGAEDILKELGFVIEENPDTVYYHLHVPKFEPSSGNKPTVAQKILFVYEEKLIVMRNTSRTRILNFCEDLKFNFLAKYYNVLPSGTNYMDSIIQSITCTSISNEFEWTIVSKFFIELGLEFKGTLLGGNVWIFKLYNGPRNNLMPQGMLFYDKVRADVKESFDEIMLKISKESEIEHVSSILKAEYKNFLYSKIGKLEDLEGFTLPKVTTSPFRQEVAKKLGFVIEDNDDPDYYHLSVPQFNGADGEKNTEAQRSLLLYQTFLATSRKKRKEELLEACNWVKSHISGGIYEVKPLGNSYRDSQITVLVEIKVTDDFSKGVVEDYFSKLGLEFKGETDGKWHFTLI